MPAPPTKRMKAACGVATTAKGDMEVIVAGGSTALELRGKTDTVEIFSLRTEQWREAARKLPMPLAKANSAQTPGSFVLFGGTSWDGERKTVYSDAVLAYDPETESFTRQASALSEARSSTPGVVLPASYFRQCSKQCTFSVVNVISLVLQIPIRQLIRLRALHRMGLGNRQGSDLYIT